MAIAESSATEEARQPRITKGLARRIPLRLSERRLLLMGLDLIAMNGGLLAALSMRGGYDTFMVLGRYPLWFVLLSGLWLVLASAFDAYNLRLASRISTSVPAVLKAGAITCTVFSLVPYITPSLPTSRLEIVVFFAATALPLAAGRCAYAVVARQPLFQRRVLIVGAGWAGQTIAEAIFENNDSSYHVVGFVDDDPSKQLLPVPVGFSSGRVARRGLLSVLGDRRALRALVERQRVNAVVLAITHDMDGELLQTLLDCLELGADVVPMELLYEQLTGRVPVEHVGPGWSVAMPLRHSGNSALFQLQKRAVDLALSSVGLLFLGTLLPFLALGIKLDSPGPVIYSQARVGRGGRSYRMYKLRSMVQDAEDGEAVWAAERDPRATRVGRILRRTHLDELPQLWNIFKGEMSLVGPRPERPEFVEQLAKQIPFYRIRHAVKPGTAGWGLVRQGYGASEGDALVKLQYDLYYIKHQSMWLDLVILIKTALLMLSLRGR